MKSLALAALAAAPPLLAAPAPAQDGGAHAASEAHVSRASRLGAGGGASASASFRAVSQVAGVPREESTTSVGFAAAASLLASSPELGAGAPVVLGASPDHGGAAGGDLVRVLGVHLEEPGGGAPQVRFGTASAAVVGSAPTWADALAPAGVGPGLNPLGPVAVEAETAVGAGLRADAYVYSPGLSWSVPPRVGEPAAIGYHGSPGEILLLLHGSSIPGLYVPVAPLAGSLELLPFEVLLGGAPVDAAGDLVHAFPVPDLPALEGFLLEVQGISLSSLSPIAGAFTNRLTAIIGG